MKVEKDDEIVRADVLKTAEEVFCCYGFTKTSMKHIISLYKVSIVKG